MKQADRLRARVVPVRKLSAPERDRMFALFSAYYEAVSRARFEADLAAKDAVILLLERRSGEIQGFSTLKNLRLEVDGRIVYGLFSGDTVVDRTYWGQRVLGIAFLKYLWWRKLRHPLHPCWWFLISKGYKTYLLMANNFLEHWPRYEQGTPPARQRVLEAFAKALFPSEYDPATGLIAFPEDAGHLKAEIAPIDARLLRAHPRVAFFEARNPTWREGTELACIARMTWSMPLRYGVTSILRRLGRGRDGAAVEAEPTPRHDRAAETR